MTLNHLWDICALKGHLCCSCSIVCCSVSATVGLSTQHWKRSCCAASLTCLTWTDTMQVLWVILL